MNSKWFRKKPVVIEAVQMTDDMRKNGGPFPEWALPHLLLTRTEKIHNSEHVHVQTLEGPLHVSVNDWLIRGIKGEVYPIKPDIFEATYEAVDEPTLRSEPMPCCSAPVSPTADELIRADREQWDGTP